MSDDEDQVINSAKRATKCNGDHRVISTPPRKIILFWNESLIRKH